MPLSECYLSLIYQCSHTQSILMERIEKTVFISYRRTNTPWALAFYQHLTNHGYDVFFDYKNIKSGDFEQIIAQNIRGRAHFLVILTPSALERCTEPGDWLRYEIELAIEEKRNIIPLFLEGFNFGTPSIEKYLTGKLALLKRYNGLNVPADYFEAAMTRLRAERLNVALNTILHPISTRVQRKAQEQQIAAAQAPDINANTLTAQEWFEKGYQTNNPEDGIYYNSQAIKLQPDYADAYYNRGVDRDRQGDQSGAIADYTEAIRLKPDYAQAYYNRGVDRDKQGDQSGAIADYTEAIRLDPDYAKAYYNRGIVRSKQGDQSGALADYTEAIRLKPDFAEVYYNRGFVRDNQSDQSGALADYTEAIRLKPDYISAYFNRAIIYKKRNNRIAAIADYQKYLDLGGGIRDGDQEAVEKIIRDLKNNT